MNITVINGTPVKGVTYHMKKMFLEHFDKNDIITEFYPKDMPDLCVGCKNCFLKGEALCPHKDKTMPVWESFMRADLIVFAYPVYALRAPASIKTLLDHFCVHWMVHRPKKEMFSKTVVIITNSVGAPNGSAQRDVKTSFSWMGVSNVHTCGAGMMGDIFWDKITSKSLIMLQKKTKRLYKKVHNTKPSRRMRLKEAVKFKGCKMMHRATLKNEDTPSLDNLHYIEHGWIKAKPAP